MVSIDILPDSEFSYAETEICPNGSLVTPDHITGTDGFYSYTVVSGGPSLVIEELTGVIDPVASDEGTYEVTNAVFGEITPFISEIHYDNAGTDTGESIELTGSAGTDLTGYT